MANNYLTSDNTIQEIIFDYYHFCQECPKAYDFTCSGFDSNKCQEEKKKLLTKLKKLIKAQK